MGVFTYHLDKALINAAPPQTIADLAREISPISPPTARADACRSRFSTAPRSADPRRQYRRWTAAHDGRLEGRRADHPRRHASWLRSGRQDRALCEARREGTGRLRHDYEGHCRDQHGRQDQMGGRFEAPETATFRRRCCAACGDLPLRGGAAAGCGAWRSRRIGEGRHRARPWRRRREYRYRARSCGRSASRLAIAGRQGPPVDRAARASVGDRGRQLR